MSILFKSNDVYIEVDRFEVEVTTMALTEDETGETPGNLSFGEKNFEMSPMQFHEWMEVVKGLPVATEDSLPKKLGKGVTKIVCDHLQFDLFEMELAEITIDGEEHVYLIK